MFVVGGRLSVVSHDRQAGGLEGFKPSKNFPFLVVVAGFAGNDHQKH
jgi:hypothetical protein